MQFRDFSRFAPKTEATSPLVSAAIDLLNGALSGDPHATNTLITSASRLSSGRKSQHFSRLTPREQEALELLNEEKTTRHICSEMWIEPSTLRDYKASIRKAYDLSNTKAAIKRARELGDISHVGTIR